MRMERPVKSPKRASELFNLGITEFNQSRHHDAVVNLKQAATLEPGNATYAAFCGQAFYHTGDYAQAKEFLTRAVSMDPDSLQAWKYLGLAARALNDPPGASEAFGRALEAQPNDALSAQLFMENLSVLYFTAFNEWLKKIILLCLQVENADHQIMSRAWADVFMFDPAFAAIRDVKPDSRIPSGLNELYLNLGLQRFYVCLMSFERAMTKLRHLFLNKSQGNPRGDLAAYQTFFCSLATQMWLNEYVYITSAEEEKAVAGLKKEIEEKTESTPSYIAKLCLYGCYAPLMTLKNAKEILQALGNSNHAPLKKLLQMQIAEALEENQIKQTIKHSNNIKDDISQAVRAQYEENPYPRWRYVNRNIKTDPMPMDVLIAGCGTGMQTALCAALNPHARIHSFDLSLNSLAYAARQTKALGFNTLTFEQADILNFDGGGKKYDMIECIGVLHHMKDPEAGLKSLLKHLKPDGKMWLGLYSAIARHDISVVRKMIAEHQIKSRDLRNLRQEIADHPDPLVNYFVWKSDFYTTSSCCDLIWHAQEYHYTLPEIAKLLQRNGLEFGEFFFTNKAIPADFHSHYPDEADLKDLQKWHEYELKNPALFAAMYMFTVRRA